jgi:hypothetical protein
MNKSRLGVIGAAAVALPVGPGSPKEASFAGYEH